MARIVLAPYGTLGDVLPLMALANELVLRGHDVVFCAPPDYQGFISENGFKFKPCGRPFSQHLQGTYNEVTILRRVFAGAAQQFADLEKAVATSEAIIGSMLQLAAPSLAEQYDIPYFYATFSPTYLETHKLPMPIPIGANRKITIRWPWLIALLFRLRVLATPMAARGINGERKKRGLTPIRNIYRYLTLSGTLFCAFDDRLTPKPSDVIEGHVTGHWLWTDHQEIDPQLERFLGEGEPPIYWGLGSMLQHGRNDPLRHFCNLIEKTERRAIIVGQNPSQSSSRLYFSRHVPHLRVFPRCSMVIHHGGAGTLAVAARCGVPQLIVPHLGDQPYAGQRVVELGLGPKPIRLNELTESRLREGIEGLKIEHRQAARTLASQLGNRSGVSTACDVIEKTIRAGHRP